MITTEQAIQMAREIYGDFNPDGLAKKHITALCNAVRRRTLLEAAEWVDNNTEITGNGWSCHLRRMAEGE